MGFDSLLGNSRLKAGLAESFAQGKPSHLYLICGPAGSGKHTLAKLLAAALLCQGRDKPCLTCPSCRKVLGRVHPDVITVDDPEHKAVGVDPVRRAREDLFIRPNEGARKIYVFPQELTLPAQNALLKVLEEPPSYGAFLLLADCPEKFLPAVRSRCAELRLEPLPEDLLRRELTRDYPNAPPEAVRGAVAASGGYLGQARSLLEREPSRQSQTFAQGYAAGDRVKLAELLAGMEKWKRDELAEELALWLELCTQAMACRAGRPTPSRQAAAIAAGRDSQALVRAAKGLEKAIAYLGNNVSPAAVCGYLAWALGA